MTFRHFSGGPVVKNLPFNAGMPVPSLGGELGSHVLWDNYGAHGDCEPQLEKNPHAARKDHDCCKLRPDSQVKNKYFFKRHMTSKCF